MNADAGLRLRARRSWWSPTPPHPPARPPAPRTASAWWRGRRWRPAWWVVGTVAVVVTAVLLDLPTHTTTSYRSATLQTYLAGVTRDVAQCRDGLRDAVRAYVGSVTGTPVVGRGVPVAFDRQAISACSFTNSGIVNLGSTEPPASIQSPGIDRVATQVDAWAYLDAFTLLQDLGRVEADPGQQSPRSAFDRELAALQVRLRRIDSLVAGAERADHAPLRPMALISPVTLLPHGTLPHGGRST